MLKGPHFILCVLQGQRRIQEALRIYMWNELRSKGILKDSTPRVLVRGEWDLKSQKDFSIQRDQ